MNHFKDRRPSGTNAFRVRTSAKTIGPRSEPRKPLKSWVTAKNRVSGRSREPRLHPKNTRDAQPVQQEWGLMTADSDLVKRRNCVGAYSSSRTERTKLVDRESPHRRLLGPTGSSLRPAPCRVRIGAALSCTLGSGLEQMRPWSRVLTGETAAAFISAPD